jgi:hypothetical protein
VSVDYYVAVHQANWPTAASLQTCMAERNYPVRLERSMSEPLDTLSGALPAQFQNREIELEASVVQLSSMVSYAYSIDRPPDWADGKAEVYQLRPDEALKARDVNTDLAKIGAKGVAFGNGDYVLTLSFHSSSDEVRAGIYLMAAMINCFGGYGFEFQGGTHGTRAFADELVGEAADEGRWK